MRPRSDQEADHNGVNLVSGRTEFALPVLSVPAAPNLRFDRIQNAAPYILGRVSGQAEAMPVGNWSIHAPGATESFVCVDWMDCGSVTGTGSYFRGPAGAYGAGGTYRQAGTGAVWTFAYGSALGPGPVRQSYASNVNYPGGERIIYSYDDETNLGQTIYRPTRIAMGRTSRPFSRKTPKNSESPGDLGSNCLPRLAHA